MTWGYVILRATYLFAYEKQLFSLEGMLDAHNTKIQIHLQAPPLYSRLVTHIIFPVVLSGKKLCDFERNYGIYCTVI